MTPPTDPPLWAREKVEEAMEKGCTCGQCSWCDGLWLNVARVLAAERERATLWAEAAEAVSQEYGEKVRQRDEARAALATARRKALLAAAERLDGEGFDPWVSVRRVVNTTSWDRDQVNRLDTILDAVLADAVRMLRGLAEEAE